MSVDDVGNVVIAAFILAVALIAGMVKKGLSADGPARAARREQRLERMAQAMQRAGFMPTVPPAAAPQRGASGAAQRPTTVRPVQRAAPAPAPPAPAVPPRGLLFGGAFSDPAHARTAVILAEILAPPVALR